MIENELKKRIEDLEKECIQLKKINESLLKQAGSSISGPEHSFLIQEALAHEINERKKAEYDLKRVRDLIYTVIDTANMWVIIVDKDLNFQRVNKTCEKSSGYSLSELVGKNIRDFIQCNSEAINIEDILKKAFSGEFPNHEAIWIHFKNGCERLISWSISTLSDNSGKVEYLIACGLDITEINRIENERLKIENKYHSLLNFIPQTIFEKDYQGYITFINKHGLEEFRLTEKDLQSGIKVQNLISEEDQNKVDTIIKNISFEDTFSGEFTLKRKDGTLFPAWVYTSHLTNENDHLRRYGLVINITKLRETQKQLDKYRDNLEEIVKIRTQELSTTISKLSEEMAERKRIEQALRDSESKYRELVENANSIILRVDINGVCTFFNEFGQSFFGFSESEVVGKKITDTIVPEKDSSTGESIRQRILNIFHNPEDYYYNENENVKKSGERIWIAWNNKPVYDKKSGQHQILCVGTDITSRKKTEEALKSSESIYRYLFEDSPAGSIIIGTDGLFKKVNKSFYHNLGYTEADLIGKDIFQFVIPEQKQLIADRIQSLLSNAILPELDVGIFAKDKSLHYTRFSGKASVIKENGVITGLLLTSVDVTQRLQAEELNRQQQIKLLQADKMATLGILVSGVAHEINNPNNFILLNSNNINDVWKDTVPILDKVLQEKGDFTIAGLPYSSVRDDIPPLISGIAEGAERIRLIVQSLKDFARKDSGTLDDRVNVNSVIETSILILNNLIKKSTHHFTVNYCKSLSEIRGNFQQVEQVLINLITNACQALTDPSQAISVNVTKTKEDSIIIEVVDEGKGIAPEHINHILDPFFTTKRDSGGTGLGLSISYNIIKDHDGELQLSSELERGTTARVILPVYKPFIR